VSFKSGWANKKTLFVAVVAPDAWGGVNTPPSGPSTHRDERPFTMKTPKYLAAYKLVYPLVLPLMSFVVMSTAMTDAAARALTPQQARAAVAPFYDALNAAPGRDAAALVLQATQADWVSCGGNDACAPRDKVAQGIAGLSKAIPDLKWEIKDLLVSGDKVVVRGEASGTPAGEFMGVPHSGKRMKLMSIDIHTIRDGKIVRSFHVEDWIGGLAQLSK
jgi:ketosteroid isomerase-like protein